MKRHTYASFAFVLLMLVTGYLDPVLALDAGLFSLIVGVIITTAVRWWKESKHLINKMIDMTVGVSLLFLIGIILYMPLPMVASLVVSNYANTQATTQLREVVIALHNWHQDHQAFPTSTTTSEKEPTRLNWRVYLLPYLGYEELYKQFRLDEPWDSPHNLALLPHIPSCYQLPGYGHKAANGGTYIQLIVGPGAVFDPNRRATIPQLQAAGRLNSTLIAGIAHEAVPWTKPADLTFEVGKPLQLGRVVRRVPAPVMRMLLGQDQYLEPSEGNRRYRVVFADASVGEVNSTKELWKLSQFIQWNGPKPDNLDDLRPHSLF